MNITQNITLDLTKRSEFQYVSAIQGDNNSRYVNIALTNAGETYQVPQGVGANFRAQKPDGTMILNQAAVNEDGTVTVELTQQTLAVCGDVLADVYLTAGDGAVLSSFGFVIHVESAPMGDQVDSTNEFLVFLQLAEQAEHAATQAEKDANRAEYAANQAADKLPLAGGMMKGSLNMGGQPLKGLPEPKEEGDAVPKEYVVPKTGGTMKGPLNMGKQPLKGLAEPKENGDAVPKEYVVPKTGGTFNGNVSVVGELGATKFQTKVLSTGSGTVFDAVKSFYPSLNVGITLLDLTVQGSHYTFFVEKANSNYGSALMISYSAQVKYKLFNGLWSEVAY